MQLFAHRKGKLCCDLGLEMRLHFFHPQRIQNFRISTSLSCKMFADITPRTAPVSKYTVSTNLPWFSDLSRNA
uniref:Uncharacterized protein n=1 Tax=Anguilla anguilla TaxID=7936 RepID=A0A0E9T0G8_ANGAN